MPTDVYYKLTSYSTKRAEFLVCFDGDLTAYPVRQKENSTVIQARRDVVAQLVRNISARPSSGSALCGARWDNERLALAGNTNRILIPVEGYFDLGDDLGLRVTERIPCPDPFAPRETALGVVDSIADEPRSDFYVDAPLDVETRDAESWVYVGWRNCLASRWRPILVRAGTVALYETARAVDLHHATVLGADATFEPYCRYCDEHLVSPTDLPAMYYPEPRGDAWQCLGNPRTDRSRPHAADWVLADPETERRLTVTGVNVPAADQTASIVTYRPSPVQPFFSYRTGSRHDLGESGVVIHHFVSALDHTTETRWYVIGLIYERRRPGQDPTFDIERYFPAGNIVDPHPLATVEGGDLGDAQDVVTSAYIAELDT